MKDYSLASSSLVSCFCHFCFVHWFTASFTFTAIGSWRHLLALCQTLGPATDPPRHSSMATLAVWLFQLQKSATSNAHHLLITSSSVASALLRRPPYSFGIPMKRGVVVCSTTDVQRKQKEPANQHPYYMSACRHLIVALLVLLVLLSRVWLPLLRD